MLLWSKIVCKKWKKLLLILNLQIHFLCEGGRGHSWAPHFHMVTQCPSLGHLAQVPHSILLTPHWGFWASLSLLSYLSVAGNGWLNRSEKNTSIYSCIPLQSDFSFFTLWSDEDYVNRTGRISLGECAIRKVHALFLFHLFQGCAFSVSVLSP